MPTLPRNTKCSQLGCKNPRAKLSSLCIEHGGKDTYSVPKTKERQEFSNQYNESGWKKLRAAQLSIQPLCQACLLEGKLTNANQVDHLFSWSHIGKEAFYRNIFQSLCIECHTHKTALERKNVYRHYLSTKPVDYALSDYSGAIQRWFHGVGSHAGGL